MGFSKSKSGQAEIIVIGDEVISGFIVDTNSKYLGQQISELGMGVLCITKIGDDSSVLKNVLKRLYSVLIGLFLQVVWELLTMILQNQW